MQSDTFKDVEKIARDAGGHFERTQRYECGAEGHIFGTWRIFDRMKKYRRCVIPGCGHVQQRQVGGA